MLCVYGWGFSFWALLWDISLEMLDVCILDSSELSSVSAQMFFPFTCLNDKYVGARVLGAKWENTMRLSTFNI